MQVEKQTLAESVAEISARIDRELDILVPDEDTEPVNLHKAIRHSLFAGGKRFRPALLTIVGRTFGAEEQRLLRAAAAIEMTHTYSLIHDDLPAMDDDPLRRGKPSCHTVFGEATAILAGDVLQTLAVRSIAEDELLSAQTRVDVILEIALATGTPGGMAAGQQLDLEAEGTGAIGTIDELENVHRSKTGALIVGAARSGAIIAEVGEENLLAVTEYARQLGLLFQITDDLLDVTQTTETLGKTAGKDAAKAKSTYPSILGTHKTRNLAMQVFASACEPLEKVSSNTDRLFELAEHILMRKS